MKTIETLWFTNIDGCIGIVVVEEDVTGDRKAYIGLGKRYALADLCLGKGIDEKADIERILARSNKFPLDTALRLRHLLTEKKEKKCDFNCGKTDEPLIAFSNTDSGDNWLCHLSCLKEQIEVYGEIEEEACHE